MSSVVCVANFISSQQCGQAGSTFSCDPGSGNVCVQYTQSVPTTGDFISSCGGSLSQTCQFLELPWAYDENENSQAKCTSPNSDPCALGIDPGSKSSVPHQSCAALLGGANMSVCCNPPGSEGPAPNGILYNTCHWDIDVFKDINVVKQYMTNFKAQVNNIHKAWGVMGGGVYPCKIKARVYILST